MILLQHLILSFYLLKIFYQENKLDGKMQVNMNRFFLAYF